MMISQERIAALLPHGGAMCLLDSVTSLDAERILCLATSHLSASNPMRRNGRLGILCGVEYAAQAMALHAALTASAVARPNRGYLAALRSVAFHRDRLDDVRDMLAVEATCLHQEMQRAMYGFSVRTGARPLLDGRAVVVLRH
ncbi:MAG TPA: hypothetical protein VHB27_13970 [Rhodopila sp.]|uniref:hypothetical protein n=1 Tax=Rhodopila sp. TaxID=2480087 RepID=UPI002B6F986A|nr:hypothetical protein [Rhodopila sp.]HVY16328.1 hypothetical protein [Rhodopila sp.]